MPRHLALVLALSLVGVGCADDPKLENTDGTSGLPLWLHAGECLPAWQRAYDDGGFQACVAAWADPNARADVGACLVDRDPLACLDLARHALDGSFQTCLGGWFKANFAAELDTGLACKADYEQASCAAEPDRCAADVACARDLFLCEFTPALWAEFGQLAGDLMYHYLDGSGTAVDLDPAELAAMMAAAPLELALPGDCPKGECPAGASPLQFALGQLSARWAEVYPSGAGPGAATLDLGRVLVKSDDEAFALTRTLHHFSLYCTASIERGPAEQRAFLTDLDCRAEDAFDFNPNYQSGHHVLGVWLETLGEAASFLIHSSWSWHAADGGGPREIVPGKGFADYPP